MRNFAHLTCGQNLPYGKIGHMASSELMASADAAVALDMPRSSFNRRVNAGLIPFVGRLPGKTGAYLFDPNVINQLAKDNSNENAK